MSTTSTTIGAVIGLAVEIVPSILSETGTIPPGIATEIENLGAALPGLVTSLTAGKGPTDDAIAALQALQTEIGVLKAGGTLPADKLALADSLDTAITNAITGYQDATKETDPSKLTDLPETL